MTYTAVSEIGVCCYVDVLRSLTSQAELVRLVHILPGHISHKGRQYMAVRDFKHDRDKHIPEFAQVTPASTTIEEDNLTPLGNQILRIEILARAQNTLENAICCAYKIYTPTASFNLHPGLLMMQILYSSGLIPCSNGPACNKQLALPCSVVQSSWQMNLDETPNVQFLLRIACCIWPPVDDLVRCIALQAQLPEVAHVIASALEHTVFIRRRECLPCCTLAVVRECGENLQGEPLDHEQMGHII